MFKWLGELLDGIVSLLWNIIVYTGWFIIVIIVLIMILT